MHDSSPGERRVVLEDQEPLFISGATQVFALRLERHERLDVVAHDPWEREVSSGRHEVAEVERSLAARLEERALVMRRGAGCTHDADPRDDLTVAFDEIEEARFSYRLVIVREIAR